MLKSVYSGKLKVIVNEDDGFYTAFEILSDYREGRMFMDYEPEFTAEFVKLARQANTIYDVGANIGLYSLAAALTNPNALVVAFEPERRCNAVHEESIKLNGFDNINIIAACLGDLNENTEMTSKGSTGHYITRNDQGASQDSFTIPMYKLDDLVKEENLSAPDVLKIDVEGYEFHVLRGMEYMLKTKRPIILLELHRDFMQLYGEDADALIDWMNEKGYDHQVLRTPGHGKKTKHKQVHMLMTPRNNAGS